MELPVITSCDNCGACCFHMGGGPVTYVAMLRHADKPRESHEKMFGVEDVSRFFNLPQAALEALHDPGEDGDRCCWLSSDNRCRFHEFRPTECREFKVGGESCQSFRQQHDIKCQAAGGFCFAVVATTGVVVFSPFSAFLSSGRNYVSLGKNRCFW